MLKKYCNNLKKQVNLKNHLTALSRGWFFIVLLLAASLSFATPAAYVVTGIKKGDMFDNIMLRIGLVTKQKNVYPKKRLRLLKENIILAMQPFGYYKPSIRINRHHIHIKKGRPVIINHIVLTIDGPGRYIYRKQRRKLPLEIGQILNTRKYQKLKEILFEIADKKGFLKAHMVKSEVMVNTATYKANIVIHFNTGEQYYFGKVQFNKTLYNDAFLHKYVDFSPLEPYSPKKIADLNQYLSSTDYFSAVNITPRIGLSRVVPIDIALTTKPSQSYTIGAGFGTDTGIRGRLGWKLLHVTDTGHTFRTMIQASQKQNYLQGQYLIPGPNPITQQFSLTASVFQLDYPVGNAKSQLLTAAVIHHKKNRQYTLGMNALFEEYQYIGGSKIRTRSFYPHLQVLFKHVSDPLFAKKGYNLAFKFLAAQRALGADQNILQFNALFKEAMWLAKTKTRFFIRGEASVTRAHNIFRFPLSLQLLAGGAQSIRGYNFQGIGPGKRRLVGSAEIQQQFKENWFITAFYDIGDVYDPTPRSFKRGVGGGLMWASPVGAIRVSLARALDKAGRPFKFVFSMGPDL